MIFGFLIFPGLEELDLVGPWEMISFWSKYANGPENCLMVAQSPEPVICAKGMSLNPHATFAACPRLDYLLVPGGEGTRKEVDNKALIQFVSDQAVHCQAVLSVCTGTFIQARWAAFKSKGYHPLGFSAVFERTGRCGSCRGSSCARWEYMDLCRRFFRHRPRTGIHRKCCRRGHSR